MLRFALDSDDPNALDDSAHILLTYSDLIQDPKAWRDKHPGRACVLIDRGLGDPSGEASVWDVEKGALRVEQLPEKYDAAHERKVKYLTVYCSRDTLPAVATAMGRRNYWLWVATLDGSIAISGHTPLRGPAAIQCFSAEMLGIHADGSVVTEPSWNPTPALDGATRHVEALATMAHSVSRLADNIDAAAHLAAQDLHELR